MNTLQELRESEKRQGSLERDIAVRDSRLEEAFSSRASIGIELSQVRNRGTTHTHIRLLTLACPDSRPHLSYSLFLFSTFSYLHSHLPPSFTLPLLLSLSCSLILSL